MKALFAALLVLVTAMAAQADPTLRACLLTKAEPLSRQMQAASTCATDKSCDPAPLSGYERHVETLCFEEALTRCDESATPGQCLAGITDFLTYVTTERAHTIKADAVDAAIAPLPFFQKRSLAKAYRQHVEGVAETDCDIPEARRVLDARLPPEISAQTLCATLEAFGQYQILRRLERALAAADT